jgi:ribokinase
MKDNSPNIVVVGSSNTDLLTKVDRLPKLGETMIGKHFHVGFGGKGANQAVMAAKLQANVTMVTKLGNDIFGKETLNNFKNYNINTDFVYFCDVSSGVAPIFVDDKGNNFIVIVPGANWELSIDDVHKAEDIIVKADILICQLEIPVETTLEALRIAFNKGATTILNPAPAMELSEEIYKYVSVIAPNEIEASMLTNIDIDSVDDARKAATSLNKKGAKNVIITLGSRGVLTYSEGNFNVIAPIKVNAIDTTGAGDAFIGAFAYFYAKSKNILESAKFANIAAGLSVTKLGTQTSFPELSDIEKIFNS